jgi:hypothetical protein
MVHEPVWVRVCNPTLPTDGPSPLRSSDKEEVLVQVQVAEQFGSRLDVVASVDRDGSQLLASQRGQREAAALTRQTAVALCETAAQLRRSAVEMLEIAAELRAQASDLRAQVDKERKGRIVGEGPAAG